MIFYDRAFDETESIAAISVSEGYSLSPEDVKLSGGDLMLDHMKFVGGE